QGAILQVCEQVGDIPHVVGDQGRIVHLVFERVTDVAVASIERTAGSFGIESTAVVLPGDAVGRQNVSNTALRRGRDYPSGLYRPLGSERGIDVYRLPELAGTALGLHTVGQRLQVVRDRGDTRLTLVGAIEPLCALGIEVQRAR